MLMGHMYWIPLEKLASNQSQSGRNPYYQTEYTALLERSRDRALFR